MRSRPELLLLVAGLLPAVVVYGLHWRRGYFLDDPLMDAFSLRELVGSVTTMRARPLGTLLVAVSYLIGEPAGRAISAVALGASSVLAGLLVRRTCGGRYGAVVAALLVIYPILDWESALYWYAAIQYPAGAAFGLAGAHAFLNTLRAPDRRSAFVAGCGSVALYAGALACTEVGVNFLLLVPGLFAVEMVRRGQVDRQAGLRLAGVTAGAVAVLGVMGAVIYLPNSGFTRTRGEFIVNPIDAGQRIIQVWIPALRELAFSPTRGRIHLQALKLGAENLGQPVVLLVFLSALAAGAVAVRLAMKVPPDRPRPGEWRSHGLFGLVSFGLFLFALCFPAGFLSGQGPVSRLLFAPWTALALAVGAGVSLLESTGRTRAMRRAVALAAAAVFPLALTLDGYGELFRLRDARNDQQLTGWLRILDAAEPLPPDLRIASFYASDQLLDGPSAVDHTIAGLTETPWALSRMVFELRRYSVFAIGGHPVAPVCVELTADPTRLRVTSSFNDEVVSPDALLAVEVHGPRLVLIRELVFGSTAVGLPLADRVMQTGEEGVRLQSQGNRICRWFGQPVS
ncbi:MAG: hypothetical protein KY454_04505 [Actinobacteria bacterium]|nr:hypothetical protein [Actinomycetota bacterium]